MNDWIKIAGCAAGIAGLFALNCKMKKTKKNKTNDEADVICLNESDVVVIG
jgi:hypothetical protein